MSNFYYCNDCMKPVDLEFVILRHPHDPMDHSKAKEVKVCKECGGTNWHAEIDKGTHYEQVKE